MIISNLLHFTAHHRFYIFRDFSMSQLDGKMLSQIYQPMIGAFAIAVYQQMYHMVAEGKTGYSTIEPLRKLLLGAGLEMNEASRKFLLDQMSKLEAIGLLQSYRLATDDGGEVIYEFELVAPLSPTDFFSTVHLAMLLRDKVGKYAVIEMRESLSCAEPDELAQAELMKENLSIPFYELFKLNTQSFDLELEQALQEVAPTREKTAVVASQEQFVIPPTITYGEIILRFPRGSVNRPHVEKLRMHTDILEQLNYVAYKYQLSVVDICRILDEDGVFGSFGELQLDEIQLIASQMYRQDSKREQQQEKRLAKTAVFQNEEKGNEKLDNEEAAVEEKYYLQVPDQLATYCDISQYNMLMRNEPCTHFLKRFFPGAVPQWLEQQFEHIDVVYKLAEPVVNVLIHYVIGANDSNRITKSFIDAVASNMLIKKVTSFEKAVMYVREQIKLELMKEERKEIASGKRSKSTSGAAQTSANKYNNKRNPVRAKPEIPIISSEQAAATAVSADEMMELRKLARKLTDHKNG
ncbi:helicase DnaB [Paenibacillus yanchengensis]|uniref:Helicase DnaB n=1 Tax=Paenibacillus yanchengensis TaxID=2035833 RepID=A0ABW4YPQ0_9BACL